MKRILKTSIVVSLASATAIMTGCATPPPPKTDTYQENLQSRLATEAKTVNDQLFLLMRLEKGESVPAPEMAPHNQNMDARKIDPNYKLAYNNENGKPANLAQDTNAFHKKVKIQWDDNSLNTLVNNVANAVGYDFSVVGSKKDMKVTLSANNVTLEDLLKQIAQENPVQIAVSHKNKTITLIYK